MAEPDKGAIFASSLGRASADRLLDRIKAGEVVSVEERLTAIKNVMATSPRDWAAHDELWML